jgi:leucyl-tRNA synthetase
MIEKYGIDTTRLFILYKAPVSEDLEWDEQSIIGMERWLKRLNALASTFTSIKETSFSAGSPPTAHTAFKKEFMNADEKELYHIVNKTIKEVIIVIYTEIFN